MLNDQEKQIISVFMSVIPKLSEDIIDRIIFALNNEKRVLPARKALAERLAGTGMSYDEAYREAIKYQRLVEDAKLTRESIIPFDKSKTLDKSEKSNKNLEAASKPIVNKKYDDDLEELIDELNIPDKIPT
jgi:HD superfamily phosphohydrolase